MGAEAVGVVLAAGMGTRVGADGNKAYLPLDGRSMLVWSLDTLARVPQIARTVLVYRQGELRPGAQHRGNANSATPPSNSSRAAPPGTPPS